MADCTKCANRNNDYCIFACENGESFKPITNADRVRAMADEELAEWLFQAWHNSWYTLQEWLDWLKEDVKDG